MHFILNLSKNKYNIVLAIEKDLVLSRVVK
jgi:hypothetical protein